MLFLRLLEKVVKPLLTSFSVEAVISKPVSTVLLETAIVLNNAEIYVENNNAYLVSKMELNEDILTKESLKIIKDAIKNTTGKEYIVEYVKEK